MKPQVRRRGDWLVKRGTQFGDAELNGVVGVMWEGGWYRQLEKLRGEQVQSPSCCAADAMERQQARQRPCEGGSR